jgi:hypothetical protein
MERNIYLAIVADRKVQQMVSYFAVDDEKDVVLLCASEVNKKVHILKCMRESCGCLKK